MNIDEQIKELEEKIAYIELVLKEKKDERFWLIAEKKEQENEKKLV